MSATPTPPAPEPLKLPLVLVVHDNGGSAGPRAVVSDGDGNEVQRLIEERLNREIKKRARQSSDE